MLSGGKVLLRRGKFEFEIGHLLIIAVLAICFTTAFIMRAYPAKYGFYLNEFDPYFDYRATKYIVDNGLEAYLRWHDTMSWYPEGRNVPATSQSGLHIIAAYLYQIFGGGMTLLDFTILFPAIIGSLTTIVMFALVRTIGGNTAGLFSALLFAFTPAIISRGNLGWFKSEPLGLFLGLLSIYFLLSAMKNHHVKFTLVKAIGAGLLLGLANASWGGIQYFSIPISLFFICLPFFQRETKIPMYVAIAFTMAALLSAGAFPRPGMSFVFGLPGIALVGGTIFLIIATFLKKKSRQEKSLRNLLFLLTAFVVASAAVLASGSYYSSSFRYLNAINPFLSAVNPLTESVAEHFTPTLVDYFTQYSILLIFAGFGAWTAFRTRDKMYIFALIVGLSGLYVSATFARLLVYASIGVIILAGIGLYQTTRSVLESRESNISEKTAPLPKGSKARKKLESMKLKSKRSILVKVGYFIAITFVLAIPMIYPPNSNWLSLADIPPSIANGGTGYRLTTTDWLDALEWIERNTPENSVIASWWDYGYWITTLGNRTSLADNATINQTRIAALAKMFIDEQEGGIKIAQDLKADYILVYLVAQRFPGLNTTSFYTLGNGGDESKKQWFMRIGGFDERNYLEQDGVTPTPRFWNSTLLGKLIPFTPVTYASFQNGMLTNIQNEYAPGTIGLYAKDIKFPTNETAANQPLSLAYASPSFRSNSTGLVFAVLLYKVNHDYKPSLPADPYQESSLLVEQNNTNPLSANSSSLLKNSQTNSTMTNDANPTRNTTASRQIATIDTSQGPIRMEFFPDAAPKHVNNFISLANKGFYDETLFHRIDKGFVIQAGDNNTKPNGTGRERWGTGSPGYSIEAEFTNIPHKRGIVSMARTTDPNSAGSQFFIVLNDSQFLDNQYTVFGRVTEGMNTVDKIASVPTNEKDQPADPEKARIKSVRIKEE
jgi:dolichyl-diphosphooligosaccharide---protein glycosyltransferase